MDAKIDPALEQQFDLNLIEAVKMNPVIYDRSHFNYKHFVRKAQTWKQIAESLGVPGETFRGFPFWRAHVSTHLIKHKDKHLSHMILHSHVDTINICDCPRFTQLVKVAFL